MGFAFENISKVSVLCSKTHYRYDSACKTLYWCSSFIFFMVNSALMYKLHSDFVDNLFKIYIF